MHLSGIQRAALSGLMLSTIALTGCSSGGGGGSTVIPTTGGSTLSGGAVNPTVSFGSFATGPLSIKESRTLTPAESGYSGAFTATSTNAGVVSVAQGATAGTFVITGVAPGTATISLADTASRSGAISLTVGTIGFGTLSAATMAITESRTFSPSESGYTGTFTIASSSPNVVAATPASGAGPFMVTALSAGMSTIALTDSLGHTASFALTVAAAGTLATPIPGTTPTPIVVLPTLPPVVIPTLPPIAIPTLPPTPFPISLSPTGVTLGVGNVATVAVALPGGASQNGVTATALDNTVAMATNLGGGNWQIVENGPGPSSINFSDGAGHTATLAINAGGTPAPIHLASSNGINLTVLGILSTSIITPAESGYAGTFTVTSSNTAITLVAPIPLTNTYLVTSAGAVGNAILNVSDTNGSIAHIGLNVH